MKNYLKMASALLLMIISTNQSVADIKAGDATVIQGNTTTVSIGAAYQATLNQSTGISYTWTAGSSAITITSRTSKSCTIKGNTVGTTRLNYHCSYYIDGFYRTMDFYYDITIKSNTISVTRIEMNPSSATLDIGQTIQLSAIAYPTNATNRSLNWATENYSVASVSSSGLVTARGEGKVWIWARAADGSGAGNYCVITVNPPTKVNAIQLSQSEATMNIGESCTLSASVLPANATNKTVNWTSDNPAVATVKNGVVSAIAPGECEITCAATDGSLVSAVCHVKVLEPEQYWLSVVLPNGTFSINATELEKIEIDIAANAGYAVHSVSVNGEELEPTMNGSILTLPALSQSATVNVVFEYTDFLTETPAITDASSPLHLTAAGNVVEVEGLPQGETVWVYKLNGELALSTRNSSFTLNPSEVYIVRIGTKSFKIAL